MQTHRPIAGPSLAHFRALVQWVPKIGDFVVWCGWFRTWYGVIAYINPGTIHVVFETLPVLLVTSTPSEQTRNTRILPIDTIKGARSGNFSLLQHDDTTNTNIWYV